MVFVCSGATTPVASNMSWEQKNQWPIQNAEDGISRVIDTCPRCASVLIQRQIPKTVTNSDGNTGKYASIQISETEDSFVLKSQQQQPGDSKLHFILNSMCFSSPALNHVEDEVPGPCCGKGNDTIRSCGGATIIPLAIFGTKATDTSVKNEPNHTTPSITETTMLPFCANCLAFVVREKATSEQLTALSVMADQMALTYSSSSVTTEAIKNGVKKYSTRTAKLPRASSIYVQLDGFSCKSDTSIVPNVASISSCSGSSQAVAPNEEHNGGTQAIETSEENILAKIKCMTPKVSQELMKQACACQPVAQIQNQGDTMIDFLDSTRNQLNGRISQLYTAESNDETPQESWDSHENHGEIRRGSRHYYHDEEPYDSSEHSNFHHNDHANYETRNERDYGRNNIVQLSTPRFDNRRHTQHTFDDMEFQNSQINFNTDDRGLHLVHSDMSQSRSSSVQVIHESWESIGSFCASGSLPTQKGTAKTPATLPKAIVRQIQSKVDDRLNAITEAIQPCVPEDINKKTADSVVTNIDYETRRAIASRMIGQKLAQGYKLTDVLCELCGVPFLAINGQLECVTCPAIILESLRQQTSGQHWAEIDSNPSMKEHEPEHIFRRNATPKKSSNLVSNSKYEDDNNKSRTNPPVKRQMYHDKSSKFHAPHRMNSNDSVDGRKGAMMDNSSYANRDNIKSRGVTGYNTSRSVSWAMSGEEAGDVRTSKKVSQTKAKDEAKKSLPRRQSTCADDESSFGRDSYQQISNNSSLYFQSSSEAEITNSFVIPTNAKVRLPVNIEREGPIGAKSMSMSDAQKEDIGMEERSVASESFATMCGTCGSKELKAYQHGELLCLVCFNTFRAPQVEASKQQKKVQTSERIKTREKKAKNSGALADQTREQATQRMCRLLEAGWEITASHCNKCLMPIMYGNGREVCVSCGDAEMNLKTSRKSSISTLQKSLSDISMLKGEADYGQTKGVSDAFDRKVGDKLLDGWMMGSSKKCLCGSAMMRPPGSNVEQCVSDICALGSVGNSNNLMKYPPISADRTIAKARKMGDNETRNFSFDSQGVVKTDDLLGELHQMYLSESKSEDSRYRKPISDDGLDESENLSARRKKNLPKEKSEYDKFSMSTSKADESPKILDSHMKKQNPKKGQRSDSSVANKLQEQLQMAAYLESLMN